MECQWCCHCSRGLPPLSPGARSGGAVVGHINCQTVWWVVEADSTETKRPCGTFPQSHTSTYYLHFNVPFCFQTDSQGKKILAQWVHVLLCQSKDDARGNFSVTKSVPRQHVLTVSLSYLLTIWTLMQYSVAEAQTFPFFKAYFIRASCALYSCTPLYITILKRWFNHSYSCRSRSGAKGSVGSFHIISPFWWKRIDLICWRDGAF